MNMRVTTISIVSSTIAGISGGAAALIEGSYWLACTIVCLAIANVAAAMLIRGLSRTL
jgi:hypothetical protein